MIGVLFDIKYKALEVLALRVIDIHGVVSGLSELMEDTHFSARARRCREDGQAEHLACHHLRS